MQIKIANKKLEEEQIPAILKEYNGLDLKNILIRLNSEFPNSSINHEVSKLIGLIEDQKNELEMFIENMKYDLEHEQLANNEELWSDAKEFCVTM